MVSVTADFDNDVGEEFYDCDDNTTTSCYPDRNYEYIFCDDDDDGDNEDNKN